MSDNVEDKLKSPFDSESEDDTIALSTNELDNILSEAEIVEETSGTDVGPETEDISISEGEEGAAKETGALEDTIERDTEPGTDFSEDEEFDISGEIDELSPEDLENIEIEESEVDTYAQELEDELGSEQQMPEMKEPEFEEEGVEEDLDQGMADMDAEGITLEANLDEEMDLDTYLDSVKSDIDLESADLGEGEETPVESPDLESIVLGEEEETPAESAVFDETGDLDSLEASAEEAFKEAGIEGIADELEAAGIELEEEGVMEGAGEPALTQAEVETAGDGEEPVGMEAGTSEFDLDIDEDLIDEDLEITEEPVEGGMVISEPSEEQEEAIIFEGEPAEEEAVTFEGEPAAAPAEEEVVDLGEESFEEEMAGFEEESIDLETAASELKLQEDEGIKIEEEPFEGEVTLTEEEEQILSEDFDLEEETAEGPISEEVVTVTGEELSKITGEEEWEPGTAEPEEGPGITAEKKPVPDMDETTIDNTLFNDITIILKYMDNLLGELPEEKIKEFSQSKYFSLYKEVFEKMNIA